LILYKNEIDNDGKVKGGDNSYKFFAIKLPNRARGIEFLVFDGKTGNITRDHHK